MYKIKIDFKDLKGPFLVYSITKKEIQYVSPDLLTLLDFDNVSDFKIKTDNQLDKILKPSVYLNFFERYNRKEEYFHLNTSYFNGSIKYFDLIVTISKKREDYAVVYFTDLTEKILNEKKITSRDQEVIQNRGLLISSFVDIYDSICGIRLDTFESCQIISDGTTLNVLSKRPISVDWDDYYNFFLQLIDKEDYERLKGVATKEGLINLLNSDHHSAIYYFRSEFDLATGRLKEEGEFTKYSLYISIKFYNTIPYAFVMIKNEEENEVSSYKDNQFKYYQYDYLINVYVDYNDLSIRRYTSKNYQKESSEIFDNVVNYDDLRVVYCEKYVTPEEQKLFLEKTSISNVKYEVEHKGCYVFHFKTVFNGITNLTMLVFFKEKDDNGNYQLVIGNRMEYDNLADPNIRDSLTGLLNQNSFMAALASEIYCGSKGYLVRFDIEHFSSINSLFGYSEGDNMLKKIGKILQAEVDKYHSFASRASADIFFIYLPISEDEVKDYIIELDSKLKEISDVLDIRLIFGASSIDVASSQQAIENCNIAADSVRDHEDMIFTIYNKELMEKLITKKNEVLDIVDKIRNHKIKVGFRKIYDNTNKVVAFDSGYFCDANNFKMKKENLFLFLERNKMIVKLNQMTSKAVYKLMSECWNELEGYTFIVYASCVYLENDRLRRNLIKFINDTNIPNDKYVLSVQCDSCGKNKKKMIEAFKDILSSGIQMNIDFSNNTKVDYTLFGLVNIKNIKVDLRNFVNIQDGSIDYFLIENVVKTIIGENGTIYIGHADKKVVEILKKYKNVYYSLDNEPILSSEEVLKEFKNKKI